MTEDCSVESINRCIGGFHSFTTPDTKFLKYWIKTCKFCQRQYGYDPEVKELFPIAKVYREIANSVDRDSVVIPPKLSRTYGDWLKFLSEVDAEKTPE